MAANRSYESTRPLGITVIVVIMWIQGLLGIVGGLITFFERNNNDLVDHYSASSGTLGAIGIALIVIGLITILLAQALSRGSAGVQLFVGLISAFNLGVAIWGLIALAGTGRVNAIVQGVIAAVVLYILFNRDSQEFFAR